MSIRKPTILITEPDYFTDHSINSMRRVAAVTLKRVTHRELLRIAADFNGLVVRIETRIDKAVITNAKNLQCIVTATTGLNHIDSLTLQKRGIPLFSLQKHHSIPTAEHTLALIFALARNIPWADSAMKSGNWQRWKFIGTEMHGKTLGIYGFGRIGTIVSRYAQALGMTVIAHDPYVTSSYMKARGARKVTFNILLRQSNVLTLHSQLTQKTLGRFGLRELQILKKGTLFINTSRGLIVDTEGLICMLESSRLRAAIDVYDEEPLGKSHRLRVYAKNNENLILTPHLGGSTDEAVKRASNQAAKYIVSFFSH